MGALDSAAGSVGAMGSAVSLASVAMRRRAGFDTYVRMPLDLVLITVIAVVIKYLLHPVFGVPLEGVNLNRTDWWFAIVAPAVTLLWALLRYGPAGRAGAAHKRGTVVLDGHEALQTLKQTERLKERHGHELLTLAGVWVPPADETKHFKLIGTTGAGKSTAIWELLHQALQRGDRAVIADPDGGYLARFYDRARGDVILNPFDARSRKWSVFADVDSIQDADLLARSLIPDSGSTGSSGEREWSGYARTFVSAVLRQCMANGETDSAELWRLIATASTDELRTLLQGTAAQPFLEAENARMFGSIRSVATSAIAALEYVNAQEGGAAFSVRQWVRSGRGVLFLPYPLLVSPDPAALSAVRCPSVLGHCLQIGLRRAPTGRTWTGRDAFWNAEWCLGGCDYRTEAAPQTEAHAPWSQADAPPRCTMGSRATICNIHYVSQVS